MILAIGLSAGTHPATAAAYATAACDPAGQTAADAAVATQLNTTLSGAMRGSMDAYRVSCARMVIKAVAQRGQPQRAAVIALAAAMVDSGIQNISEELDNGSLGLFRMRPAWGSSTQRLDATWAANAFLDKMISLYPDRTWVTAPIGEVCQAVQASAYPYPYRYQAQAADAQIIVNTVWPHVSGPKGVASLYGVLPDGRLTYTAIDAASGQRTSGPVLSAKTLGFTPKAMATLNADTLLVTENGTAGKLYRVDVQNVTGTVEFAAPVYLGSGYTHDLLAYDGGFLFGITGGALRRYIIRVAKPALADITGNTLIGTGFTLKTLTTTGPGWILGTTDAGALISYKIGGADLWRRYQLRDTTWQVFDRLLSPGAGVYYGRKADGSLHRYFDINPFDGEGADVSGQGAVDSSGWTQTLLSAQPGTVTR
ncbi:hypothetical protein ACTWPT_13725 [Nonomuraea sp. 3N208]|uniref:hypothetical protein n=1 Tax=Nonomuraea sp. 3N208 TaxID=3457421 RepID=UPI003FCC44EE